MWFQVVLVEILWLKQGRCPWWDRCAKATLAEAGHQEEQAWRGRVGRCRFLEPWCIRKSRVLVCRGKPESTSQVWRHVPWQRQLVSAVWTWTWLEPLLYRTRKNWVVVNRVARTWRDRPPGWEHGGGSPLIRGCGWEPSHDLENAIHLWDIPKEILF